MRKLNILYCSLPLAFLGLYQMSLHFGQTAVTFYGFAENKETQINIDYAITVNHVAVTAGQFVKKGDLLAEVTRTELELKISDATHGIAELESSNSLHQSDLQSNISRLRAQRAERVKQTETAIESLRAQIALNQSLVKGLKSVRIDEKNTSENEVVANKIRGMQEELRLALAPMDIEIRRMESELRSSNPVQSQISRLKDEQQYYQQQQQRLAIVAPNDGLIGFINCKKGENIPAFTTLISFYEENPTQIVAYVHEGMMLDVQVGDSLLVQSSLHLEERCIGKISGLGHRIVEIPERLRKIPEIRTYGREVLLQIPEANHLLQNEKVVVQILRKQPSPWDFWFPGNKDEVFAAVKTK